MTQRRFTTRAGLDPWSVRGLAPDHPAMTEERTLFPSTVVDVTKEAPDRLLVSGANNRKLGATITKGVYAGYALYGLSLEERATCPISCSVRPYCLAPGTRVLTADLRWVPIESLDVGHEIVGFDERRGANEKYMTRIATVEALGRTHQPSYRIKTNKGEVVCSANHLWLGRQNLTTILGRKNGVHWLETENIKVGAEICFIATPWELDKSFDGGRLRGFVEGEGTMTCVSACSPHAKARISWAQRPGALMDEINEIARNFGFSIKQHERWAGVNHTRVDHADLMGGWKEVVRFLGMFRPTRFIQKAKAVVENHAIDHGKTCYARVEEIEPIGGRELVTIATSTKTLIAEGLCSHNCYGNGMQMARRHRIADLDVFHDRLAIEIEHLLRTENARGLMVRLHVLGDFPSVEYVAMWADLLSDFPRLATYGYTARIPSKRAPERIGEAIDALKSKERERFRIRWSNDLMETDSASVIRYVPAGPRTDTAIVCPAQLKDDACCASCALCWEPTSRAVNIAFVLHGAKSAGAAADNAMAEIAKQQAGPRPVMLPETEEQSPPPSGREAVALAAEEERSPPEIPDSSRATPFPPQAGEGGAVFNRPKSGSVETEAQDNRAVARPEPALASIIETRRITPISIPSKFKPNEIVGEPPEMRLVSPLELLVEPSYQRDLSGRSVSLIRKIVTGWDWAKFKAPICAETRDGLFVIDGQHTAIAAACHPKVWRIPVMVMTVDYVAARAAAFVSHNRDRISMSPAQLLYAEATAGESEATAVLEIAHRVGASVPRQMISKGRAKPGEVAGVTALRHVYRSSPKVLEKCLRIAVRASCAPVTSTVVYALQMIFRLAPFDDVARFDETRIADALFAIGDFEAEAAVAGANAGMSRYRAGAGLIAERARTLRDRAA